MNEDKIMNKIESAQKDDLIKKCKIHIGQMIRLRPPKPLLRVYGYNIIEEACFEIEERKINIDDNMITPI